MRRNLRNSIIVAGIVATCVVVGVLIPLTAFDISSSITTSATLGATLFAAYTAWLARGTASESQSTQLAAKELIDSGRREQERQNERMRELYGQVLREGAPIEMDLADAFDEEPTDEDLRDAEELLLKQRMRISVQKERFDHDWSWLKDQMRTRGMDPLG